MQVPELDVPIGELLEIYAGSHAHTSDMRYLCQVVWLTIILNKQGYSPCGEHGLGILPRFFSFSSSFLITSLRKHVQFHDSHHYLNKIDLET